MDSVQQDGYYPLWLTDEEVGNNYKQELYGIYDDFFTESNPKIKSEKLKTLKVYLSVVCDVIAYRYLVKHYTNLFYKLNITVEEYMDYKVDRLYYTIKDKKTRIDDILSYIYMSFMLSSPRLIYDYGEKAGKCKLIKETLPYYQTQRLKFFFIEKDNTLEHIIYNLSITDIDSADVGVRSDLDRYSFSEYVKKESLDNYDSSFDIIRDFVYKTDDYKYVESKEYLLYIFDNWKSEVESDYNTVKQQSGIKDGSFSLVDYIKYKFENKQLELSYDEYIDVLSILGSILKMKKKVN